MMALRPRLELQGEVTEPSKYAIDFLVQVFAAVGTKPQKAPSFSGGCFHHVCASSPIRPIGPGPFARGPSPGPPDPKTLVPTSCLRVRAPFLVDELTATQPFKSIGRLARGVGP